MTTKKQHIGETFNREQSRLKNYIKNRIGSAEDAEDIVQDVFLSLVGGLDDISDLRKTISWLYSVAKNKIVDYRRKKRTSSLENQKGKDQNQEEVNLQFSDLIPSLESLPDEQMMMNMIWDEIQMRLQELPKEQREVFEWHELEGYSFQQMSDFSGAAVNTLISRKRYAVLYLREHLEELFKQIKD